jgi:hypothetical protein
MAIVAVMAAKSAARLQSDGGVGLVRDMRATYVGIADISLTPRTLRGCD